MVSYPQVSRSDRSVIQTAAAVKDARRIKAKTENQVRLELCQKDVAGSVLNLTTVMAQKDIFITQHSKSELLAKQVGINVPHFNANH